MVKAIETEYNGYRFRSRLEARWAVFFDAVDLRYEYEPEGFDLGNDIWYLPDFATYWPTGRIWYEIKPTYPKEEDLQKCIFLASKTKDRVAILCGNVGIPKLRIINDDWQLHDGYFGLSFFPIEHKNIKEKVEQVEKLLPLNLLAGAAEGINSQNVMCDWGLRCFSGDKKSFDWWPIYLKYKSFDDWHISFHDSPYVKFDNGLGNFCVPQYPDGFAFRAYLGDGRNFSSSFLYDAYKKARQARFEHGESP